MDIFFFFLFFFFFFSSVDIFKVNELMSESFHFSTSYDSCEKRLIVKPKILISSLLLVFSGVTIALL